MRLQYPSEVWGANFSVKREAILHAGPFRSDLGYLGRESRLAGEETELCYRIYRAGGAVYYCGQAVVTHVVSKTRLTKRYFRQTAYWRGRTMATLLPSTQPRWRHALSGAYEIAKQCLRVLKCYGSGDIRKAFFQELLLRRQWGALYQTVLGNTLEGYGGSIPQEKR